MIELLSMANMTEGGKIIARTRGAGMERGDLFTLDSLKDGYGDKDTKEGHYFMVFIAENRHMYNSDYIIQYKLFISYDSLDTEEKFIYHVGGLDALLINHGEIL